MTPLLVSTGSLNAMNNSQLVSTSPSQRTPTPYFFALSLPLPSQSQSCASAPLSNRSPFLAPATPSPRRRVAAPSARPSPALNWTPTMVLTSSTMLPLGTPAVPFYLPEPLTGRPAVELADVRQSNGLLVIFMCNHCPFVKFLHDFLPSLGSQLAAQSVGTVGISSNDAESHPEDGPAHMKTFAESPGLGFPYLYDETQLVAKAYRAACTPDFYLFDKDLKLVYRGQLDDATPGNGKSVTGSAILSAVTKMVAGTPIPDDGMHASMGCNIKWKVGNEPAYFG